MHCEETHNLTQPQRATWIGSGQSRVSKIEAGSSEISLDLMLRGFLAASGQRTNSFYRPGFADLDSFVPGGRRRGSTVCAITLTFWRICVIERKAVQGADPFVETGWASITETR